MCTLRYAKESVSVGAFLMFVNRFAVKNCRSQERRHKK